MARLRLSQYHFRLLHLALAFDVAAAAAAVLRDCDCTRMAGAVEVVVAEPDSAVQVGRFDVGEADHATAVYHKLPSDAVQVQEAAAVVADSVVRSAGAVSVPSAHLHIPTRRLLLPRAAAAAGKVDLQARADRTLKNASTRASGLIALWRCDSARVYLAVGVLVLLRQHSHAHARRGVLNLVEAVLVHRYTRVVVPGHVAIVHVLAFEVSMAQGLAGEVLAHKHV